jgi:hypothetical protein
MERVQPTGAAASSSYTKLYVGRVCRSPTIRPPVAPLTDGVVVVRQRRTTDLNASGTPSHDTETRRWLQDVPMGEQERRTNIYQPKSDHPTT